MEKQFSLFKLVKFVDYMKVGIVTVAKKIKEGYGLEDIVEELKNRKIRHQLIHPQEIFWEDGDYKLFKQNKNDGYEVLSLREETKDVDIFYMASQFAQLFLYLILESCQISLTLLLCLELHGCKLLQRF